MHEPVNDIPTPIHAQKEKEGSLLLYMYRPPVAERQVYLLKKPSWLTKPPQTLRSK
jgi:hypothetical protein